MNNHFVQRVFSYTPFQQNMINFIEMKKGKGFRKEDLDDYEKKQT